LIEANYGKCRDLSVIWEFSKYVLILNDDKRADLNEAMEEYATGKTTSLKDAERILDL